MMILFGLTTFLFFGSTQALSATTPQAQPVIAEWKNTDLSVFVSQAAQGPFLAPEHAAAQSLPASRSAMFLGLTIEFHNQNPHRKIDLNMDFGYHLRDEFQNEYRQVEVPGSASWAGFPRDLTPSSIYPEGLYRKTVFFENPVAVTKSLVLTIDAQNLGRSEPITLTIRRDQIPDLTPLPQKRLPQEEDFAVLGPPAGTSVRPGTVVHIGIQIPADVSRPQGVYIISPNDIFEDRGSLYQYDIRIPKDQPQGPFVVVVMARWEQGQEIVLSKSITLEVTGEVAADLRSKDTNQVD